MKETETNEDEDRSFDNTAAMALERILTCLFFIPCTDYVLTFIGPIVLMPTIMNIAKDCLVVLGLHVMLSQGHRYSGGLTVWYS